MLKPERKCCKCNQSFPRDEIVDYASENATSPRPYCPKCLIEKKEREKFIKEICIIFGIKRPGPKIWTQRKRIIETYGYTDNIIVDCLDYLYNVEKVKKITETLGLVTPTNVNKMMKWKKSKEYLGGAIANAMQTETKEQFIPIKEAEKLDEPIINPDDWIDYE